MLTWVLSIVILKVFSLNLNLNKGTSLTNVSPLDNLIISSKVKESLSIPAKLF